MKFEVEGGTPEMRKLSELKTVDPTEIYAIGDNLSILKFEVGPMTWLRYPVETDRRTSDIFNGSLRYASIVHIPPTPDAKIIMTGGC